MSFYCSLLWGQHSTRGGGRAVVDRDRPGRWVDQGQETQPFTPGPHARGICPNILYWHYRDVWTAAASLSDTAYSHFYKLDLATVILHQWSGGRYQKTLVMKWSLMILGNRRENWFVIRLTYHHLYSLPGKSHNRHGRWWRDLTFPALFHPQLPPCKCHLPSRK